MAGSEIENQISRLIKEIALKTNSEPNKILEICQITNEDKFFFLGKIETIWDKSKNKEDILEECKNAGITFADVIEYSVISKFSKWDEFLTKIVSSLDDIVNPARKSETKNMLKNYFIKWRDSLNSFKTSPINIAGYENEYKELLGKNSWGYKDSSIRENTCLFCFKKINVGDSIYFNSNSAIHKKCKDQMIPTWDNSDKLDSRNGYQKLISNILKNLKDYNYQVSENDFKNCIICLKEYQVSEKSKMVAENISMHPNCHYSLKNTDIDKLVEYHFKKEIEISENPNNNFFQDLKNHSEPKTEFENDAEPEAEPVESGAESVESGAEPEAESVESGAEPEAESVESGAESEENILNETIEKELSHLNSGKFEYRANKVSNIQRAKLRSGISENDINKIILDVKGDDKKLLRSKSKSLRTLLYVINESNLISFLGFGELYISKSKQARKNRDILKYIDVGVRNFYPLKKYDEKIFLINPKLDEKLADIFNKTSSKINSENVRNILDLLGKKEDKSVSKINPKIYSEKPIQENPIISSINLDAGIVKLNSSSITIEQSKNLDDEQKKKELKFNKELFEIPVEVPNSEELEKSISLVMKEFLLDRNKIMEIIMHLTSRHVILTGAIGTGKTSIAEFIPKTIWGNQTSNGYETYTVTATNEWTTSDVIEGTVPKVNSKILEFEIKDGCVVKSIKKHLFNKKENKNIGNWLIIDEFNRADIDKAFGQLFTGLTKNEIQLSLSEESITIPRDFRIIGTMNTNDKTHLFKLSDALKRRFSFVEIPAPSISQKNDEMSISLSKVLEKIGKTKESFKEHVSFDDDGQINYKNSNDIGIFDFAYNILAVVRCEKQLGTAILNSIYENLVTGILMGIEKEKVLDYSLSSNLAIQLELSRRELFEIILEMLEFRNNGNRISQNLRNLYNKSEDKEAYKRIFFEFSKMLGMRNEASKRILENQINDGDWNSIDESWIKFIENSQWDALNDLKEFKMSLIQIRDQYNI